MHAEEEEALYLFTVTPSETACFNLKTSSKVRSSSYSVGPQNTRLPQSRHHIIKLLLGVGPPSEAA